MSFADELDRIRTEMFAGTKPAFMWVHPLMPYNIGYPGMIAELYFSSPETFRKLLERDLGPDDGMLVPCTVPADFTDWDFIPNDY